MGNVIPHRNYTKRRRRRMIDIDKNLKIFYEREENKEDEYIGAISKHECVVDGWFVIELLEEVKRLRGIAKTCLEAIEAGGDIRSKRV